MILVCPNCQASFNVPDNAIPAEGRNVKCSSCENIWIAKNESSTAESPSEKSIRSSIKQPSEEVKTKAESGTQARYRPPSFQQPKLSIFERPSLVLLNKLAFSLICLAFISVIGLKHNEVILKYADYDPELGEIIRTQLGIHENSGIKLLSVDCTVGKIQSAKDDNQSTEVEVKIVIENIAKTPQVLDVVNFTIFDKDRNNLGNFTMDFMKKLEPGKQEVIEGRLNRIPKSTMFVAIEAGNKLDTTLRHINNIFD